MISAWNKRSGAVVQPVYVLSPAELNLSKELSAPWLNEYESAARKALNQLVADMSDASLLTPEVLIEGTSATHRVTDLLAQHALREGAEAILVTSHGRRGLRRLIMGSFAESLLLRSQVPVLVLGPQTNSIPSLDHILFPTELNTESRSTLKQVAFLAQRLSARLTLFHSVPRPIEPIFQSGVSLLGGSWVPIHEYFSVEIERIERRARAWAHWARQQGVDADFVIDNQGSMISTSIFRAAKRLQCGLIAIEARSGRIASALIGSVTREVIRQASVPVWVVRENMIQPEARPALVKPILRRAA